MPAAAGAIRAVTVVPLLSADPARLGAAERARIAGRLC
jgi:hypothetical protein